RDEGSQSCAIGRAQLTVFGVDPRQGFEWLAALMRKIADQSRGGVRPGGRNDERPDPEQRHRNSATPMHVTSGIRCAGHTLAASALSVWPKSNAIAPIPKSCAALGLCRERGGRQVWRACGPAKFRRRHAEPLSERAVEWADGTIPRIEGNCEDGKVRCVRIAQALSRFGEAV